MGIIVDVLSKKSIKTQNSTIMKKTTLLFSMMLMSTLAFGQIQKGDIQLGGGLNYSKLESNGFEATNFRLTPNAALFLSDKTSLGLTIGYQDQSNGSTESNQFLYGVYARFHKNVSDKFYLFLQPDITLGTGTGTAPITNQEVDVNSFNFNLAPGIMYFLSEKVALEMSMGGIFYRNTETEGVNEVDQYGLNFNLSSLTLGASIYLRK